MDNRSADQLGAVIWRHVAAPPPFSCEERRVAWPEQHAAVRADCVNPIQLVPVTPASTSCPGPATRQSKAPGPNLQVVRLDVGLVLVARVVLLAHRRRVVGQERVAVVTCSKHTHR